MHPEVRGFLEGMKEILPKYFRESWVLEIGSANINGSVREYFEDNRKYVGVDVAPFRGVDVVSLAHELKYDDGAFNVVISAECLEHDRYWCKTIQAMHRMLAPGGLLIITCATTGRKEHGTRRTGSEIESLTALSTDLPDYYQNLTEVEIRYALDLSKYLAFDFITDPEACDLYFWGIKREEKP